AADVQFAEIYDCFSSTVVFGLEGLGFCGRGEAIEFVRSGATAIDGTLPVNTNGGLLAEGYLHGMKTVAEAVLKIQGRCGDRQVPRHEVGGVTSGALVDGSALVLVAAWAPSRPGSLSWWASSTRSSRRAWARSRRRGSPPRSAKP